MKRRWIARVFLLGSWAILPAGLGAQYPKQHDVGPGSVDGTVVNAKGAPVAGATVLWQVADGERPHILHSDAQGHFHISGLRAGLYDLRASSGEASSDWEHNVMVRPGGEASVKLRVVSAAAAAPVAVALKGKMRVWDVPAAGALPVDSAVDAQGNVWVALSGAGQIGRFAPEPQEWKLYKIPSENSGPSEVVCDSKGFVWFTESRAGKIGRLDPKSSLVAEYSAPTAKDPRAIVIGPDGALWFTARDSNLIGRVDLGSGKITEFSVPSQNAHPGEIVSAGDGALWFSEMTGQKLGRVDPRTGQISEFAPQDTEIHPRGLVAVPGAIYFTDNGGGRLGRFTLADGKFHVWESPDGVDSQPVGIAVDSTGKIWYQESAEKANKLVRVDPATLDFNVFPMPLKNASVDKIARDAKGRLWMALSLANKIMVVE